MPDEEMEMAIDFGQAGFGEDIDIDLDFPAGPADDIMDLEDFDKVHDIHNFNSDTRDELMGEGDDVSYGMIDANEIDHNISTAAANDIDIELEHTVESIWQHDPSHSADFNPDTETGYLDAPASENMDAEKNDAETGEWLPAVRVSPSPAAKGVIDGAAIEIYPSTPHVVCEEAPVEPLTYHENPSPPAQMSHIGADVPHYSTASDLKGDGELDTVDDLPEEEVVGIEAQISEEPSPAEQDQHKPSLPEAGEDVRLPEPKENQATSQPDETAETAKIAETGPDHVDEPIVSQNPGQPDHPEISETSNVQDHADLSQPTEAYESADDASEYLLGETSYVDTTNDQIGNYDYASQAGSPATDRPASEPTETRPVRDIEQNQNEDSTTAGNGTPGTGGNDKDDAIELADQYGVYISYGETDYQLFAKSEDDDPNQYFLTDKSVLDASLGDFLASMREVISEEISPLDDLVMEIDGLGLEISQSTTQDFLDKFTFGDLVILYDKLVRNEQAESSPPIYTFLTVKPNCTRRMMALGESANAGRGLSEVGLYRDSSSMAEQHMDGVGSPDTNFSTVDYNDGESGGIYEQEDFEESDALDGSGHHTSPPVTADEQLEHTPDQGEETGQLDNENEHNYVDNSAGGSPDAATHEHHASTSQQGIYSFLFYDTFPCTQDSTCLCDDCYDTELQHLATPTRAEVWPPPGIAVPIHNNFTDVTIANRITTEDDATSESSGLKLQEASEHDRPPNPETPPVNQVRPPKSGATPTIPSVDAPNSENTSVTATLDGEDNDENHDEIDYNSDEDDESIDTGIDGSNTKKQLSVNDPNVSVDDEITWESDDDEIENEIKGGSPKDAVQVSPVSGKRSRADADALDDIGDKNDYKRLRA
ncbi:hypothetical protein F5Y03DRAFT_208339 [Xylaria venustula]|nr:hypothetical protein F5Y03DRAFT_208339 [Xylaria venustula]